MAEKFTRFQVRWNEPLGKPECPYVRRWVLTLFGWSIRLHKWLASDDLRFFHDHAWDFLSIILKGYYIEKTPSGVDYRRIGSVRFHKAEYQHKVVVFEPPCWSLVISKPKRRNFGFWVNGRLMRPLRYFSRYGLHPCKD
jgi:hypothetical protein